VDLIGTTYTSPTLATGYGAYIAQPLLRKAVEGKEDTLTREEAEKILIECMKVLYYRDARSLNKVSHPDSLFRFSCPIFMASRLADSRASALFPYSSKSRR
jgi:20S proteasome alpha/beta subunit